MAFKTRSGRMAVGSSAAFVWFLTFLVVSQLLLLLGLVLSGQLFVLLINDDERAIAAFTGESNKLLLVWIASVLITIGFAPLVGYVAMPSTPAVVRGQPNTATPSVNMGTLSILRKSLAVRWLCAWWLSIVVMIVIAGDTPHALILAIALSGFTLATLGLSIPAIRAMASIWRTNRSQPRFAGLDEEQARSMGPLVLVTPTPDYPSPDEILDSFWALRYADLATSASQTRAWISAFTLLISTTVFALLLEQAVVNPAGMAIWLLAPLLTGAIGLLIRDRSARYRSLSEEFRARGEKLREQTRVSERRGGLVRLWHRITRRLPEPRRP